MNSEERTKILIKFLNLNLIAIKIRSQDWKKCSNVSEGNRKVFKMIKIKW